MSRIQDRNRVFSGLIMRLTPKILVRIWLSIGVLTTAGLIIGSSVSYRHEISSIESRLLSLAHEREAYVNSWLEENHADLRVIAGNNCLVRYINDLDDQESSLAFLNLAKEEYKFSRIHLLDEDGTTILSTSQVESPTPGHIDSMVQTVIENGRVYTFGIYFHQDVSTPWLTVMAPVMDVDAGRTMGVIVAGIDPNSELYPLLVEEQFLYSSMETLLLQPEDGGVRFISPRRLGEDMQIGEVLPQPAPTLAGLQAVRGAEVFGEFVDYRHKRIFAVTRSITHTDWGLVTKIDRSDALAPWRQSLRLSVIAVLALFLALSVLIWGMGRVVSIEQEKRGQERLRMMQVTIDNAAEIVLWMAQDGRVTYANPAVIEATNYTVEELLEMYIWDLDPDLSPEKWPGMFERVKEIGTFLFEGRMLREDGSIIPIEISTSYVEYEGVGFHCGIGRDITQRQHLEDQLRQSQKMEAVGRLAGGIAHDFNNILTVISGSAEWGLMSLSEEHDARERFETIQKAAASATDLTTRLLMFGRKQVIQPRVTDITRALENLRPMLERVIGGDINLTVRSDEGLARVLVDPGELDQVIMNLVVNSHDAMSDGGELIVSATNVSGQPSATSDREQITESEDDVCLAISDTGSGMDEETQSRLFEPFFTSKETGSGLGLATVYGIVERCKGRIEVESRVGAGTTMKIFLPATDKEVEYEQVAPADSFSAGGSETILLVEDQEGVREVTEEALSTMGYSVHAFSTPEEAIIFSAGHTGDLDLMITDVVMPGMSGADLAESIAVQRPGLKVLFISGYTDDAITRHGILGEGVDFLPKPYSPSTLAQTVRSILDRA